MPAPAPAPIPDLPLSLRPDEPPPTALSTTAVVWGGSVRKVVLVTTNGLVADIEGGVTDVGDSLESFEVGSLEEGLLVSIDDEGEDEDVLEEDELGWVVEEYKIDGAVFVFEAELVEERTRPNGLSSIGITVTVSTQLSIDLVGLPVQMSVPHSVFMAPSPPPLQQSVL